MRHLIITLVLLAACGDPEPAPPDGPDPCALVEVCALAAPHPLCRCYVEDVAVECDEKVVDACPDIEPTTCVTWEPCP